MQDNWSNDSLENQGWQAMEQLLDQEMPVKQKRRRPIIWFFLLFGIGIVLATGTYFLKHNPETNITHVIPMNEPSLSMNNHPVDLTMEHSKEKASTFSNASNEPGPKADKNNASRQGNKPEGHPIKQDSQQFRNTLIQPIAFNAVKEVQRKLPDPIFLSQDARSKIVQLSLPFVESLNFQILSPDSIHPFKAALVPIKQSKPSRWTNFLSGQLYLTEIATLSGGGLQVGRGLRIGSKSMISLGLGWKYHQVQVSSEITYTNDPSTFNGGMLDASAGSTEFGQNRAGQSTSIDGLEKVYHLNYIYLPLTFHYKFLPKLEWTTAFHLNYRFDGLNIMDVTDEAITTNFTQATSTEHQFNRWQFNGQVGIHYHLGPRWRLGYQYDFGLNNILQKDVRDQEVYILRHALSTRWHF